LFKGNKGLSRIAVFLIIISAVTAISVASFALKTYDPATKTLTILNPLPAAEIQLVENTDQCLADCYAIIRLKANNQLTIPSPQNDDFKWEFLKDDSKKGLESYTFELRTEVQKQRPVFSSICNPYNETANSTTLAKNNCTVVENGTVNYTDYEYVPFDFYGYTFQAGKGYYIKLRGKKHVQFANSVEWIPTFYGIQINEWAWWDGNWTACRNITASSGQPSGFIHRVEINTTNINYSKTLDRGNDLRIIPGNCSIPNSGAIEENFAVAYWNATNGSSILLINSSVNNNRYFAMYYNNSAASRFWNVTKTFGYKKRFDFNNETINSTPSGWSGNLPQKHKINATDTRFDDKYINSTAGQNNDGIYSSILEIENNTYPARWEFDAMYSSFDDNDVWGQVETGGSHQFVWGIRTNGSSSCDGNAFRYYGQVMSTNVLYHVSVNITAPDNQSFYINSAPMTNCREIDSRDNGMSGTFIINGKDPAFAYIDNIVQFGSKNYTDLSYTISAEETNLYADETQGRQAIEDGIRSSLGNVTIYTNQTIYLRYLNGTQAVGQFDEFTANGTKRWAFNYLTGAENSTGMQNLTTNVYVWEKYSLTASDIRNEVETLINATK